jgi:hypothetical protein
MNALAVLSSQERFYEQSRQEFEDIVRSLDSDEARSMTHSDLERELEKKSRELMRKLLQEHLESRGPGKCAQAIQGSDGVERSRVRPHERKLETIFGTVSVERTGYGHERNRSLHPLDAELNLPDKRYSLELCRRVAEDKGHDLTIIVDIIHVIEYLWDAGRAFYPKASEELENWVRVRILEILRGKAGYVAGGMRRSATLRRLGSADHKPVDICANYLLTYAPYLKYNQYLAQGFPIATGVIEGACRHLVKDRMEVTGARWSLTGAEAVLRLRALRSSHDFGEYWAFHEAQEYERNHRAFYANGIVPPTIQSPSTRNQRPAHLKAVK